MTKEKILKIIKNGVAVIVLLSMFVIIFYQNRDRDIFKFGNDESDRVISSATDGVMGYTGGDIRRVGDNVAYITTTSLNVLDENADGARIEIALSEPVIHAEDNYFVCYNKESFEADVYKEDALSYSVQTDNKIITAKVNKNGYLFVATEKEGYNCECRVFNRSGEAIFKWDVSKGEFLDGDINCSNNAIAISLATAGSEKLIGEVTLIDISNAKVINKESFDSTVFYTLDFNHNDTYTLLGNNALSYFNADGTQKWTYPFKDKTILKADTSNPDMIVVALSEPGIGMGVSETDVKVINRLGGVVEEKIYEDTISDISVSKSAIALAFGRKAIITNSSLKEKKEIESEFTINKVVLYNDNKHLFVLGGTGGEILK